MAKVSCMKVKWQLFKHGRYYPGCIGSEYVERVFTKEDPFGCSPGSIFVYPHCDKCEKTNAKNRKNVENCVPAARLMSVGCSVPQHKLRWTTLEKAGAAAVLIGALSLPIISVKCASTATPQVVEQQERDNHG